MMRRTILLIFVMLVPPGAAAVVSRLQSQPGRFAEVIPQGLYRGAFPDADQIRNLASDKGIRTIVCLTTFENRPRDTAEINTAAHLGIPLLRSPMPGNGGGAFEMLDRVSDALADQANWPVFFHCSTGKQRSNATLAAYRLKHGGWTIERTLGELEALYGLDPEKEAVLADHLREYAKHVAASR